MNIMWNCLIAILISIFMVKVTEVCLFRRVRKCPRRLLQSGADWDAEPNGGPNENCAQLSSSDQYYFHDEDCQLGTGSPLCQKDPVQETGQYPESHPESSESKEKGFYSEDTYCPENFTYIGKSCFYFGIDKKKYTFEDSSAFCQSINAELPVLKDCLEFQELVEEIENNCNVINILYNKKSQRRMEKQNQAEVKPKTVPSFIRTIDITSMTVNATRVPRFCAKRLPSLIPRQMGIHNTVN
ncbi:hypothetical protein Anas_01058 [Armadillidium nasatum]|uniref:C-type lectin domain-containing protein n=1 Tax=Armadillidium nasatum TaxID=96803 RepID=A0A5N5T7X8_9CRUS|nr:hypothetical protein Anas_01058 [Armadillidium nasatum]